MNALQCMITATIACALVASPFAVDPAQAQRRADYDWDREMRDTWQERQELEARYEELEELLEEIEERLEELDEQEGNNPHGRWDRRFYRDRFYDGRVYGPRRTVRYYDPYGDRYGRFGPRYRTRYYGTPRVGYFRDPWLDRRGVRVGPFRATW